MLYHSRGLRVPVVMLYQYLSISTVMLSLTVGACAQGANATAGPALDGDLYVDGHDARAEPALDGDLYVDGHDADVLSDTASTPTSSVYFCRLVTSY